MIERFQRWWRSRQLHRALGQGQWQQAQQIVRQMQQAGGPLPGLAQFVVQSQKTAQKLRHAQRQLAQGKPAQGDAFLTPDRAAVQQISQAFKLKSRDRTLWQATGIAPEFEAWEAQLAEFLEAEFGKVPAQERQQALKAAITDLDGLKKGRDPHYDQRLSPPVYLLRYFAENVYCTYLAWFWVYRSGRLPSAVKVLDIAAGPGTVANGLALLWQSLRAQGVYVDPHTTYLGFEQQSALQQIGHDFWRAAMETKDSNTYFRFLASDLFRYAQDSDLFPLQFFDFITISHCFFHDDRLRQESYQIYRSIFETCLKPDGQVLLIVQAHKLLRLYGQEPSQDSKIEQQIIRQFLQDLGLKAIWSVLFDSTGQRTRLGGKKFATFARKNLPKQTHLNPLRKSYLKQTFEANYAIDDYVILAELTEH